MTIDPTTTLPATVQAARAGDAAALAWLHVERCRAATAGRRT